MLKINIPWAPAYNISQFTRTAKGKTECALICKLCSTTDSLSFMHLSELDIQEQTLSIKKLNKLVKKFHRQL